MEYRQDDIQLALRFIEIENEIDQLTNDYGRTARTAVRLLGDAIRARQAYESPAPDDEVSCPSRAAPVCRPAED